MKAKIQSSLAFVVITLMFFLNISCDSKVSPPDQVLSVEEANLLEQEYIDTRYRLINGSLNIRDTRDFWFSLDTLKKYIKYVEQEAGNKKLENLGIRIYFAAYPEDSNFPDPGKSTVFLVPTAEKAPSPIQQGFAPIQSENENIDGLPPLNYSQGGQPPNDY